MKRLIASAVMGVAAFAGCADEALTPATSTTSSDLGSVKRYVVVFESSTLPKDAAKKVTQAGGKVVRSLKEVGVIVATGPETFAANLGADAAVLAVTGSHYFKQTPAKKPTEPTPQSWSNDDLLGLQWDMRRIGAPAVWNRNIPAPSLANPANKVAVLDTGVMYDHFDLDANTEPGKTFAFCPGDDLSGYPIYQETLKIDFTAENGWHKCEPRDESKWYTGHDEFWFDGAFHGTHVAGTIAAGRNNGGIVGVSPTTQIIPYKVFDYIEDPYSPFPYPADRGLGAFDENSWAAILDATNAGIKTINMSLGGILDRQFEDQNAWYLVWVRVANYAATKGTLIVAAAGNEMLNSNGSLAVIPSDLPNVLSVSATGTNQLVDSPEGFVAAPNSDVLAFYSNFGAAVDLSAPGGDCGPGYPAWCDAVHHIISTSIDTYRWVLDENDQPVFNEYGRPILVPTGEIGPWYEFAAGTSMAAPHVAGAAAAVRALHPKWTAAQTRGWLKSTATSMGGARGFGAGILNADAATR